MTTDSVLVGNWSLTIDKSPYAPDAPDLVSFRNGMVSDVDGQIGSYRIDGNTVFAPLANNVELVINPGNSETDVQAPALPEDAVSLQANLLISFDDGSDDLIEYATLTRSG